MDSDKYIMHRKEYSSNYLDESNLSKDPLGQFKKWFEDAQNAGIPEFNAFALATVSPEGRPSARMVLLKEYDKRGFVFYTNYLSKKGADLGTNPNASMLFFWQSLERQIRIQGIIEKTSDEESDSYFNARPGPSRVSAIISPQSQVIPDREYLMKLHDQYDKGHGKKLSRPEFWGGYRLVPDYFEFWQGRNNRLHDRYRFTKSRAGWRIERLGP